MSLINRMGTFFILLGVGSVALFILSDLAKAPTCNFLVVGVLLLALGILLWMRDPVKPGPRPERFRLVKRLLSRKPAAKADPKKK